MKVGLVHNAGAGAHHTSTDELTALLQGHGYEAVRVPREAVLPEFARSERLAFVVVAGGDGTLRDQALALVNTGVAIAPLPAGTANNIATSLGVSGPPAEVVASWNVGHPRAIDVGSVRGPGVGNTFWKDAGSA